MDFNKVASKTYLTAQRYAPEALFGIGILAGGFAIYKAIQYGQTIERNRTIPEARKRLEFIQEFPEDPSIGPNERNKIVMSVAKDLAIPAIPMVSAAVVSAACLAASFKIVNGRYAAAATALTSVTEAYARYRDSVGQGLLPAYPGSQMNEDGLGATVKTNDVNSEMASDMKEAGLDPKKLRQNGTGFGFLWDKFSCFYRDGDPAANAFHIQAVERHLNQLLIGRGHVFLNELHDQFDVPRTPEGQVVGWVRNDHYPDAHIVLFPVTALHGSHSEITIESNPMGVIFKMI